MVRNYKSNIKFILGLPLVCGAIGLAGAGNAEAAAAPSATVSIGDPVGDTRLEPAGHDSIKSFYVPVNISVSNADYYDVTIHANSSDLVDSSTGNRLNGVSGSTAISGLNNTWGFHYQYGDSGGDNTRLTYEHMPSGAEEPIVVKVNPSDVNTGKPGGATENKVLSIGYAAKVNSGFPAGKYTNEVTVAVIATPLATTMFDIEYMQEMSPDVCYATTTPAKTAGQDTTNGTDYDLDGSHRGDTNYVPTTMLQDIRDGHYYIVQKMADGNCWMTENLALAGGTTISYLDSDLDEGNKPSYTLPGSSMSFNSDTSQQMNNGDALTTASYNTKATTYATLKNFYNVSMSTGASSPSGHTGSYYNWLAAVAGNTWKYSGSDIVSGGAASDGVRSAYSICPKNWKLPIGAASGQFEQLFGSYDSDNGTLSKVWHPAYVGRGYESSLILSGEWVNWWSSTAYSSMDAYYLFESSTGFYPTHNYDNRCGMSIRCVAAK